MGADLRHFIAWFFRPQSYVHLLYYLNIPFTFINAILFHIISINISPIFSGCIYFPPCISACFINVSFPAGQNGQLAIYLQRCKKEYFFSLSYLGQFFFFTTAKKHQVSEYSQTKDYWQPIGGGLAFR